jgi:hypothetical protein
MTISPEGEQIYRKGTLTSHEVSFWGGTVDQVPYATSTSPEVKIADRVCVLAFTQNRSLWLSQYMPISEDAHVLIGNARAAINRLRSAVMRQFDNDY